MKTKLTKIYKSNNSYITTIPEIIRDLKDVDDNTYIQWSYGIKDGDVTVDIEFVKKEGKDDK